MNTLLIPDIHNHVETADELLKAVPHDEVVFLGDYFDSFDDDWEMAHKTAAWLAKKLTDLKNATFLMGNHDMPYRFPRNIFLTCPGFTFAKCKLIESIMRPVDWDKIKLCYFTQNYLISHAGVSRGLFPITPIVSDIEVLAERTLCQCEESINIPLIGAGRSRGGHQPIGGITWEDFRTFVPIPGINQIVGHTHDNYIRSEITPDSKNYCIDALPYYAAKIVDGEFQEINL